jgi:Phosphotransferase system cellobiose-specific component IIB
VISKILLACSGGFSTSILVQKMKEAALAKGMDIEILAVAEDNIESHLDADVVLLGPQIGHRLDDLNDELDIPVFVINSIDYGMMNGENVLNFVLSELES